MRSALVAVYTGALVAANSSIALLGPAVAPLNAFLLIGLDLTLRDLLHERMSRPAMVGVIALAGLISYLVNPASGQIALASAVAFSAASLGDMAGWITLAGRPRLLRINGSNAIGAGIDSVLFPALAFGVLDPALVLGLFVAKLGGGAIWALALSALPLRRGSPA